MTTTVITGANRGIGLALCRLAKQRGADVVAVCRNSSRDLEALSVEVIDDVDVTTDEGAARLSKSLGGRRVDILVNNAGILRSDSLASLDFEGMLEQYRVNALGPLRVTRALVDNLHEGSKVGIVTSRVGSIGDNGSGNNYGYRMSKAAANMAGMNLHHDLVSRGIAVALLHPGLVGTEMTGGRGIEPEKAARGLLARIDELDAGTSGRFWHAEGDRLPW
jgi:NAD(P)-dependent dehydrogenase (short-subunit alcohol dehydrogenase family)